MGKMEETISSNIKHYMEVKNLKQIDISKNTGASPATVSNWIKGIQMPRTDKIDALCSVLGVTRSQLLLPRESGEVVKTKEALLDIMEQMSEEQLKTLLGMAQVLVGGNNEG